VSPLANRLIVKMNGLGNEIAVLDLRGSGLTVSGPEARAIGRGNGLAFDQLMVLYEPRSATTEAFMTIYNSDGSQAEACGNGTRCAAFILTRGTPRERLVLETAAARLECLRRAETIFTVDMGRPRLAWDKIPLREPFHDTRKIELQIGPIDAPVLHTPSAVNMGNPHAIFWVDDIEAYDRTRQYFARPRHFPRAHRAKSLGARGRPDPRLRLGGLRRPRRGGAEGPHRPQRQGQPAGGRSRY
jgi:diaminopimelate epimerase